MESEFEIYSNLPSDPEEAFLKLERYFRDQCEAKIKNAHQDESVGDFWAEYIGRVLAAIESLGLTANFSNDRLPKVEDINYSTYTNFGKEVEFYRTQLLIRHGRRVQGYSVRLDSATKKKISHHLAKIREMVAGLELSDDKRDALYSKIEALQLEIDRDRTRLDAYADLIIEAAGTVGEAVEKIEPLRKFLETIARLIWNSRSEDAKRLPSPPSKKQIEPPRNQHLSSDVNDEIPF
jgi:hypothetical protein